MAAKRVRNSKGWAYPSLDDVTHFLLDISSIESPVPSSAIEFGYNIADKNGLLFHNGKLNLRASNDWSVALSNFYMPNNFETFPSIDKKTNLSAAFFSIQILIRYTVDDDDYKYTIKFPPKHFSHSNYTAKTLLYTLNRLIDEKIESLGEDQTKGKKIVEGFRKTVANFYIDNESNFIHFEAITPEQKTTPIDRFSKHPFIKTVRDNLKEGILPHSLKDVENFRIDSMYIWPGSYIIDYLGEFDLKSLWDFDHLSGVTFHGEILDKLIFSYDFGKVPGEKHEYVISKECFKKNLQNAVHVKTDLVATSHPNGYGNLAICAIPREDEPNISFIPPKLIWRPLRGTDIERIRFRLTDERGHLLNYNGGHAEMTLLFSPTHLITF